MSDGDDRSLATARGFPSSTENYDIVVVGGGMAGIATAVTAAHEGARVALVQDRPVLGGNASTEIRVGLEGANGGAHNRFFVESGLAEDLLLLNFWRNPTGSADVWSSLLLDLVLSAPRLTLHLDTFVHEVECDDDGRIARVKAHTLASEQAWSFEASYFVDATGDGTIAHLAGAEYMYGEEPRDRFGEPLAPLEQTDLTLGGTMWFMCRDTGRPVEFEPPSFARKVSEDELRVNRRANVWQQAPVLGGFWWIEYGGDLDPIADNPEIKRELLAEVYGVWDHVKNHPDLRERNRTLDLEWIAAMPGKRESRRVVGDHVLTETDIADSTRFADAVAFGGWSIDRHAPRGFLDFDQPPCVQVHPPGIYQIPLRSLYARDVPNLYLAGRDISYSHVACCSARVMLTCTHCGEAVGAAAAYSAAHGLDPRDVARSRVRDIRRVLERRGHYVPGVPLEADRVPDGARASASSEALLEHPVGDVRLGLERPRLLSLPLITRTLEAVELWIESPRPHVVEWRLFAGDERGNWIPGAFLAQGSVNAPPRPDGDWLELPVDRGELAGGYHHLAIASSEPAAQLGASDERPLGPLSWAGVFDELDTHPHDTRAEHGWNLPQRFEAFGDSAAYVFSAWKRDAHGWGGPPGAAISFRARPEQSPAPAAAVLERFERPTVHGGVHGWASGRAAGRRRDGRFVFDEPEWLSIELPVPVEVDWLELYFNSDVDRHLANLWYSHEPGDRAMSTLVSDFVVEVRAGAAWREVARRADNWQRRCRCAVEETISAVRISCSATHGEPYASVTDFRVHLAESRA
jgi:hypothetical protein